MCHGSPRTAGPLRRSGRGPRNRYQIGGLLEMTTCDFRVCITMGRVTGEWTQAVSALIY